ncbi:cytochrome P450 83B1-like [Neltuma alba]|uniref:cytochrome P450 83B1-like n=1 Tax=Neltuma alba TaxID=207710 RepID=UPI0010A40350|nr:cytochrome P450 83B1-like [Prosopis alba]XP_028803023.1 cytochrome P450 83B1-like [Prosopis alba]
MVILLTLFSSIFLIFLIRRTRRIRARLPPGPSGLPLIGNLHQLSRSSPHSYLCHLSQQYGPLMFLRFGLKPAIVVSSAKIARQVMKTHDLVFASRPSLLGQQKLSYNGLDVAFAPYSDYWREMKKLCVHHLFSSRRTHSFRPVREDEVVRMIRNLSLSAASHKVINLSERLTFFTSTLICRIAFGKRHDLEDQGRERSRFHGLLNEAEALLVELYFSDYLPWLGWVDRLRGLLSRLDKTFKQLDMFYQQVINDHINATTPPADQQDIINILLQIMDSQSSSFDLSLDHIKALLMNIFIAGTDTSAATIVMAMTSLIKNPRVMKKVQDEIRKLYSEKEFISEEDIERLPYLKAVVKETLRLFPPTPLLLPKESMDRCSIEGYEIQPKTMVLVNAWAIGRDPETWEEPEQFYPERFFNNCSVNFKGQDFELIPFGAGRRICPGMLMAVVTVELTLANLLHCFDWELPAGIEEHDIDTEVTPGIAVNKKNDLFLVIKNP